jgi:hypothetical protein
MSTYMKTPNPRINVHNGTKSSGIMGEAPR